MFDDLRNQMDEEFDSFSIDTMFAILNRYRIATDVNGLDDIHGMFMMGGEL